MSRAHCISMTSPGALHINDFTGPVRVLMERSGTDKHATEYACSVVVILAVTEDDIGRLGNAGACQAVVGVVRDSRLKDMR